MPADPLKLLGKYQLTDVLGEGAMGVVYRAFDPVLNRYLAIKVMSALIASDAQLRDRFLREARAAGSLQHPNVITIYDFGEVGEHLFIAMEYVEGVDLSEIIERRDNISVATKLDIITDALNGLSYAHAHGMVHRDIKPANIRVGIDAHAKLMDFGIAHLQSSEMTRSGELLGTPQYMAPEQVTGGAITPATDIFAMGSVLYELLTWHKAFAGETLHVILFNIASAEPHPIRQLMPGLPAGIEKIIAKALAKEPEARYQNALSMAKDLTAARASLSEGGRTGEHTVRASQVRTIVAPGRETSSRLRVLVFAGAVILLSATAAWYTMNRPAAAPSSGASDVAAAEGAPAATAAGREGLGRGTSPTRTERPQAPPTVGAAGPAIARGSPPAPPGAAVQTRSQVSGESVVPAPVNPTPAATTAQVQVSAPTGAAGVPPVPPAATPPTPVPAAATDSSPRPPADARPEIERLIAAYARAIESGNVAEIRRVYPGLTAQQAQGWDGFFQSVRSLKARIAIEQLTVRAASADAGLSAVYEYENKTNGQIARQPLRLQAALIRDGAGWRIASIR